MNDNSPALSLQNIKKVFLQAKQEIEAIKEVNLEIRKGELVALVGPSGSGKTTLLQIAGLLDSPSSGKVVIDSVDASLASDALRTEIRKNKIGFIYQFHHLLPEFSALENVALPLRIKGESKEISLKKAAEILTKLEMKDRLHHKQSELSGGQQQRVAIARAVVSKPSLILADEPTGNLDSAIANKTFEILEELTRAENIGCLMVTHNMDLAKRAGRIISIKDGIAPSN